MLNKRLLVALGGCRKGLESKLFEHIACAGFTPTQFAVLETLFNKGPSTVNEIIANALSSSGNIGLVIDNLIKLGLVKKKINPEDKRSRHISLTEKGFAQINEYFPIHLKAVDKHLKGLTQPEKECLIELLEKLRKNIGS